MEGRFILLLALLAAGCATTGRQPARHWLAGTWLMLDPGVEHPLACASDVPIRYDADGRYHLFEESGRWRLQGERLTETATALTDAGDPEVTRIGQAVVSRVERRGRDEFVKTFADGSRVRFRRCPRPR